MRLEANICYVIDIVVGTIGRGDPDALLALVHGHLTTILGFRTNEVNLDILNLVSTVSI